MHVKLYEDIARHGRIATTYAYPVKVEGRYVMDPSPTPKFDNPKMHMSPALQLFGAGPREAHLCDPAVHRSGQPRLRGPSLRGPDLRPALRAVRRRAGLSRRGDPRRPWRAHVRLLRHRPLRKAAGRGASRPSGADKSGALRNDRRTASARLRAVEILRRARRLRGRLLRSLAGRSAGGGRRIRLGQDDAAQLHLDAADCRRPARCRTACATATSATSTA